MVFGADILFAPGRATSSRMMNQARLVIIIAPLHLILLSDLSQPDSDVDASGLCRWCDGVLPEDISPILQKLIDRAIPLSYSSRRRSNPLGLEAPLSVFSMVCVRHEFERVQLPLARVHGWPDVINWRDVYLRVRSLESKLQEIVDDADPNWKLRTMPSEDPSQDVYDSNNEYDEERAAHPRWGSIFWKKLLKAAQKTSSFRAFGIQGQQRDFHLSQPG